MTSKTVLKRFAITTVTCAALALPAAAQNLFATAVIVDDSVITEFEIGQVLNVDLLSIDQLVNIKGKTVGKGFSGLQKRYNFTRGPMTHGSKNHRAPGSIGMGTTPGRVLPGKKMAGQLGNKLTTIKKLKVIQLSSEENILIIKGSVPGKPGNLLSITPSN